MSMSTTDTSEDVSLLMSDLKSDDKPAVQNDNQDATTIPPEVGHALWYGAPNRVDQTSVDVAGDGVEGQEGLGQITDQNGIKKGDKSTGTDEGDSVLDFFRLSRKRKMLLILCVLIYFLDGALFSLLAPFYPQEATKKGMSLPLTGFVFSINMLVSFILSPIFGLYLTSIGPRFVFLSGVFVAGVATILMGTVDKCPAGAPFIAISLSCRCAGAVGFSAYLMALIAIMGNEFPRDFTITFAILEGTNGMGLMMGPALGGVLYDLAGFGLPFYSVGGMVCLSGVLLWLVLPDTEIVTKKKTSRLALIRSPMVMVVILSTVVGSAGFTFIEPMLANHLQPFGLSVSMIGLFFVITSGTYTFLSPVWGFLSDRKGWYGQLIVMGHLVSGISFFFIGPSILLPFLPFELWTVTIGLVLQGAAFGCCIIPNMKCMLVGTLEVGFQVSIDMYAVMSGLIISAFSLGACIGPLLEGVLVQEVGFSMACTVLGVVNIVMAIVAFVFFLVRYVTRRRDYDRLSTSDASDGGGTDGTDETSALLNSKDEMARDGAGDLGDTHRGRSFSNPYLVRTLSVVRK